MNLWSFTNWHTRNCPIWSGTFSLACLLLEPSTSCTEVHGLLNASSPNASASFIVLLLSYFFKKTKYYTLYILG